MNILCHIISFFYKNVKVFIFHTITFFSTVILFCRPIIGGFLTEAYGWRSTFYFSACFGFCILLLIVFFLPETFRPKEKAQSVSIEKGEEIGQEKPERRLERKNKIRFTNPLSPLRFFKLLNVSLAVLYLGIL